jgi:hypothetical protein
MPLAEIPPTFQTLRPLEAKLYFALGRLPDQADRKISVSPDCGVNASIRSAFLGWFLSEAIRSTAQSISRVEIRQATFDDVVTLEAITIGVLLRFVTCTFEKPIRLSDAVISGFEMLGGSVLEIIADRLIVKGSMLLRAERKPVRIEGPRLAMLRLCGADIRGNLDMRGCLLNAAHEKFDEQTAVAAGMDTRSAIRNEKGNERTLFPDGLKVQGNVLLGDGFISHGEVCLNGCNIGRNLDCSGATLSNPTGHSFSAAGALIAGSAYFSETRDWVTYPGKKPFSSTGRVRLEGAVIHGELDCSGGRFVAGPFLSNQPDQTMSDEQFEAIGADGLRVGSNTLFDPGGDPKESKFTSFGTVSLINARVGGDFSCDAAIFSFPGEEPLSADGIVVEGTTFLDDIVTDGTLRFVQANLRQGCYVKNATFDPTKGCNFWTKDQSNSTLVKLGGPSCGIYAPYANIGGTFRWQQVQKRGSQAAGEIKPNKFWLHILGSSANSVEARAGPLWIVLN